MQGIYAILDEKNFDFNKLDVIVKKMINRNIKYLGKVFVFSTFRR